MTELFGLDSKNIPRFLRTCVMSKEEAAISQSKDWIEQVVIAEQFCPFAKVPFEQDKIRYWVLKGIDQEEHLEILVRELEHLDQHEEIETSLLIFPQALEAFEDYLDFLAMAMELSEEQGYEGVFQIASFHPHYQFEGAEKSDASNYTNRSPYPMLHLLREESVEKAIQLHPNTEAIPQRNIEHAQKLGSEYFEKILEGISI
ncbi:MAG: DUF1415 domain-containing protein [Bacteroidia bacterium]|nr:DUF1415 domain-containing protein [Bacteroidia bacterium]